MQPFFGPNRPRQINLGGTSTTASHASIIDGVKARRSERQDAARRAESALRIQAWYRGRSQGRQVREHLRAQFDVGSSDFVYWTRCLTVAWVGGPADEERLAKWSSAMGQIDTLLAPFLRSEREAWLVLVRQVATLLLRSLAQAPTSPYSINHLVVLDVLLNSQTLEQRLPSLGNALCASITSYLLSRGIFSSIARALFQIPLEAKSSPSIPPLISLALAPLATFPPSSPSHLQALQDFALFILTIKLLPNRLPIPTVTYLSGHLPFSSLTLLDVDYIVIALSTSPESRLHLLANLIAFGSARVPSANVATLDMYLHFLTALMDSLPPGCLEPNNANAKKQAGNWAEDSASASAGSDDESRPIRSSGGPNRRKQPDFFSLDSKTQLRLHTLWASAHVSSLLTATSRHPKARSRIFSFLISLCGVWPSKRDRLMANLNGGGAGFGLIKEVYRGWVRSSPLGKEEDAKQAVEIFTNPTHAVAWPPFLFLTELYNHALLTMGDEEFFSSSLGAARSQRVGVGNSLTLDELTSFSRQLLNIAFPLYWHEDQANLKDAMVPGVRMNWEGVRDRVTRCLQAIHARDSRRPFTPPDHWLVTSQIDVLSFVAAAVAEEQELDRPAPSSRVLSKRKMAFISPRLGVLNNIPFAIPFSVRVQIFRQFIANDAHRLGLDDWYARPKHKATIRRSSVAQDGFDQLGSLGAALKDKISITFVDAFGNEEAGIDGGGVFKEFLTSLTKEAFDTDRGLWLATTRQELYPNPHSYAKEPHQLNWYRFIGRVLGKALYEGILIDVGFASFFLGKWLGRQSYLDDLQSLDPELYQGLVFLKHYDSQAEKVEDLSLNFTVTNDEFGVPRSIDLLPNGSNIAVTRENRIQYIYLVANYRLNVQIKKQSEALFEGVAEMIDPKWLRMFNQQELQILIGGVEDPVDVDDLMHNCVYGGVYDESHATIQRFWKVMRTLNQKERQSFLRFVTSCSRPPLLGFQELNPRFSIRDAGLDDSRLPTSSTCVNLLKLPQYSNETILRQKLMQAISSNAGFDLS